MESGYGGCNCDVIRCLLVNLLQVFFIDAEHIKVGHLI